MAPSGLPALVCAVLILLGPLSASAGSLDELMKALEARGPVVARFEEERHASFLDGPLVSWGTISYTPPDTLIKQTLGPEPSLARITGDRILLVDPSGERSLSLDADPSLRAYVTPFRALLAGDSEALERHFEVEAELDADPWTLVLRPRDAKVAERIERITVAGSEDRVEEVEIHERGGDRTRLRLSEAEP